jgi:hydrogenase maturation protein HypF
MLNHPEEIEVYPFAVENKEVEGECNLLYLEPRPMWQQLLDDLQQSTSKSAIAAKFHRGLAKVIALMVQQIRSNYTEANIDRVALTGGVFQNQILLLEVSSLLEEMGMTVLTHSQVPPNDGGLSLGQIAIAAFNREQAAGSRGANNKQQLTINQNKNVFRNSWSNCRNNRREQ